MKSFFHLYKKLKSKFKRKVKNIIKTVKKCFEKKIFTLSSVSIKNL